MARLSLNVWGGEVQKEMSRQYLANFLWNLADISKLRGDQSKMISLICTGGEVQFDRKFAKYCLLYD